jgi:hypothetical protein
MFDETNIVLHQLKARLIFHSDYLDVTQSGAAGHKKQMGHSLLNRAALCMI